MANCSYLLANTTNIHFQVINSINLTNRLRSANTVLGHSTIPTFDIRKPRWNIDNLGLIIVTKLQTSDEKI